MTTNLQLEDNCMQLKIMLTLWNSNKITPVYNELMYSSYIYFTQYNHENNISINKIDNRTLVHWSYHPICFLAFSVQCDVPPLEPLIKGTARMQSQYSQQNGTFCSNEIHNISHWVSFIRSKYVFFDALQEEYKRVLMIFFYYTIFEVNYTNWSPNKTKKNKNKSRIGGSNSWPSDSKSDTLPTEPILHQGPGQFDRNRWYQSLMSE